MKRKRSGSDYINVDDDNDDGSDLVDVKAEPDGIDIAIVKKEPSDRDDQHTQDNDQNPAYAALPDSIFDTSCDGSSSATNQRSTNKDKALESQQVRSVPPG